MFTGIVETVGRVESIETRDDITRIRISSRGVPGLEIGDSIAVSGVCLTMVAGAGEWFEVEVIPETLGVTGLGGLGVGSGVNLEMAMLANGRFDGHIVQGHVDGTGRISAIEPQGWGSIRITIEAEAGVMRYVVYKGSVAVDGVSLTVAAASEHSFQIALIPHTLAVTTFCESKVGDTVNLECDIVAKYVERLLQGGASGVTL